MVPQSRGGQELKTTNHNQSLNSQRVPCMLFYYYYGSNTSRNQPKCNHYIYDYATCSRLRLDLKIFATIRPNFNYFDHSHNYDATIKNFVLLVGSILHLFSSINKLICPISCNSHQISYILKVFYNDIGVYFNVCTKIIYIYI
jgi:hypothetical protein